MSNTGLVGDQTGKQQAPHNAGQPLACRCGRTVLVMPEQGGGLCALDAVDEWRYKV
ncbi:hypothetical protein [Rhodococcoides kyotonense]|uniref:hypothetical protein n=1 Tax=Rhodococcoides kyotonense TaxID=398843 RepID=UPI001C3D5329|nr:hypothetical protein [Rhodococcus kyotonensis]